MSRIGNKPIPVPSAVKVNLDGPKISVKGPKGELSFQLNPAIAVKVEDSTLRVSRHDDERQHRALHGLTRSLLANMVTGVDKGFQKTLELVGVGYRAQQTGEKVTLEVGFSHNVVVEPLSGTKLIVEGNNRIHVQGADKQVVGALAAKIRAIRPPNAYTGKGIRYSGQYIKLKPGKAAKKA